MKKLLLLVFIILIRSASLASDLFKDDLSTDNKTYYIVNVNHCMDKQVINLETGIGLPQSDRLKSGKARTCIIKAVTNTLYINNKTVIYLQPDKPKLGASHFFKSFTLGEFKKARYN